MLKAVSKAIENGANMMSIRCNLPDEDEDRPKKKSRGDDEAFRYRNIGAYIDQGTWSEWKRSRLGQPKSSGRKVHRLIHHMGIGQADMPRIYRIRIDIETEFDRRIDTEKARKLVLKRLEIPKPWSIESVRISSRMKPKPTPPKPGPSARDILTERYLTRCRKILEQVREVNKPAVPRATVRLVHRGGCGMNLNSHSSAHIHPGKQKIWRGIRIRKLIRLPKNLICLTNLDNYIARATMTDRDIAHTMAHELAHVVAKHRKHGSKPLVSASKRLYHRWLAAYDPAELADCLKREAEPQTKKVVSMA